MTKNPVTHDMRTEAGKTWRDRVLKPGILAKLGRTLRNLQYALIGIAIFKTEGDFAQVMRVVRGMRLTGELGWYDLDERHRTLMERGGWDNVGQFIAGLADTYRRDIRQFQPNAVVVLYEADGMTGIVQDVCADTGTAFAAMKGNVSDVLLWKVARWAKDDNNLPLVALVITDHDSAGQAIFTDVRNSLPWFYWTPSSSSVKDYIESVTGKRFDPYSPMPEVTLPDVTVIHLGIHPVMLDSLAARGIDVPSDPKGNKDSKKVFTSGGYDPTQAEAIDPDIWTETLREAIEDHTDMDALARQKRIEAQERDRLVDISKQEAS